MRKKELIQKIIAKVIRLVDYSIWTSFIDLANLEEEIQTNMED